MERSYDNTKERPLRPKRISKLPYSKFIEEVEDGLVYSEVFPVEGKIVELMVSIESLEGIVRLGYEVVRVRGGFSEFSYIHAKSGANKMKNVTIEKGDRFKIFMEKGGEGRIRRVWVSYILEQ